MSRSSDTTSASPLCTVRHIDCSDLGLDPTRFVFISAAIDIGTRPDMICALLCGKKKPPFPANLTQLLKGRGGASLHVQRPVIMAATGLSISGEREHGQDVRSPNRTQPISSLGFSRRIFVSFGF